MPIHSATVQADGHPFPLQAVSCTHLPVFVVGIRIPIRVFLILPPVRIHINHDISVFISDIPILDFFISPRMIRLKGPSLDMGVAPFIGYSNQHTFVFEYSQLYIEFVPVCSILWEGQIQMTCQVGHLHFFNLQYLIP